MKSQTVADLITDILHSGGVRRIYGVVGDSLNGITDALREINLLDAGHFVLDEKNDDIASLILAFLAKHSV